MPNIVKVKFQGYSVTDYHYLTDLDLKVKDKVVVLSPNGLQVVEVTQICGPLTNHKATKWIVDKVDMEAYGKREEERRRRIVIETKLKAIEKNLESSMKYQWMAAMSPEAAELIQELKNL